MVETVTVLVPLLVDQESLKFTTQVDQAVDSLSTVSLVDQAAVEQDHWVLEGMVD
jgi:hypothetical protein